MSNKKITDLQEASSLENSWTIIEKGGQSQKASFEMIKNAIKAELVEEEKSMAIPKIEVEFKGNEIAYKINNIDYDVLSEIKDDIKIAFVRYKQYNRIIERERGGVKKLTKGRKWTVVDDTTSKYEPKQLGDNVAGMGEKIFWTDVQVLPEPLDINSFLKFTKLSLTADNIINRYVYFVEHNKTPQITLTSLSAIQYMTDKKEAQKKLRVTGKNNRVTFKLGRYVIFSYSIKASI